MRTGTVHRGLAFCHFLLAVAACLLIYFFPAAGLWPILLPVIAFGWRLFVDRPLFHDWWIDGLLAIFLVTAVIGYWAAYDQAAAWMKLRLLIAGILLYYAISTQPESNPGLLSAFWFIFGVGVSLYFLLTFDFGVSPAKFHFINQIGLKWMLIRPALSWPAIQPTDTAAGIAIMTSLYGLCFLAPDAGMPRNKLVKALVLTGFGVVLAAVILATSRGALVALAAAVGVWLLWKVIRRLSPAWKQNGLKIFPVGILFFIGLVALLLILPSGIFGPGFFIGENLILDRSELIGNGISLMRDFPFLGGGLGSFPGLFSQYVLVIPYYSLLNSHNLFVDVGIEQGMLGGLAFLLLYAISLWKIASTLRREHSNQKRVFYGSAFTSIFMVMVHGLVDDYLYSGWWVALAFFPVGMSMLAVGTEPMQKMAAAQYSTFEWSSEKQVPANTRVYSWRILLAIALALAGIGLSRNKIAAQWFANLGAVQMAKVQLAGYPANKWDEGDHVRELQSAQMLFERSLTYDTSNRIANHRLGLIKMSAGDFSSASKYLVMANQQEPSHRGVIKNLGYSYAWLGEIAKARLYLGQIPEAKSELDVYEWWWDTQGRNDLSSNANVLASQLRSANAQH